MSLRRWTQAVIASLFSDWEKRKPLMPYRLNAGTRNADSCGKAMIIIVASGANIVAMTVPAHHASTLESVKDVLERKF